MTINDNLSLEKCIIINYRLPSNNTPHPPLKPIPSTSYHPFRDGDHNRNLLPFKKMFIFVVSSVGIGKNANNCYATI